MREPKSRYRWIQASLITLMILVLAFLVVTPGARASDAKPQPDFPSVQSTQGDSSQCII